MFFESLESRRMFAAFPLVSAGTLSSSISAAVAGPKLVRIGAIAGSVTGPRIDVATPDVDNPFNDPGATKMVGDWLVVNGTHSTDHLQIRAYNAATIEVVRNGVIDGHFSRALVNRIHMYGYEGFNTMAIDPSLNIRAYIQGGPGNDTITAGGGNDTLWSGGGDDRIEAGGGNDDIQTQGGNDYVLGGDGADTVTGNSGNEWIDGGAGADLLKGEGGADSIFGGRGDDKIHGGEGDDILISVFGGKRDSVSGDGGWDNFVADKDSTEKLYDSDTLSTARKSINRISRFANPTVMKKNPVYASELDGADISDPALTKTAKGYHDYGFVDLFQPGGPKRTDVRQDRYGLNDCWFAASAAAIAGSKPWVIQRAVMPLGDGTYMVKLNGNCYRVDADLPGGLNGGTAYGDPYANPSGALWFPLLEKAMCYDMWTGPGQYNNMWYYRYSDVESDTPGVAYDALGQSYNRYTLFEVLDIGTGVEEMFNYISSNLGKAMTITTEPGVLGVGSVLRSSHAYTIIDAWVSASGKKLVKLRNPYADSNANGNEVTVGAGNLHDSCLLLYIAKS
jgi:hypothetical protein